MGPSSASQSEIEAQLAQLRSEHARDAEAAAVWLLDHREQAEPQLRQLAQQESTGNPRLALPLLARMGSATSVAVLENVVATGPEGSAWYAAQALAVHPLASAHEALQRLLKAQVARVRCDALDAFAEPSQAWGCADLVAAALGDPEPEVREHAIRAIGRVGCQAAAQLRHIAAHDRTPGVREAAAQVASQLPD